MYQPVFKNQKKEMNIEIMKEIIFFLLPIGNFFFWKEMRKGEG
jgi:hypothetical protein